MDLTNTRNKYVKIDNESRCDGTFTLLDEIKSDLVIDSDTEFVLEESLDNELDFDDKPLNLLVPKANYHVVENPTIEKTLKEGSSKAEKKVKGKNKEKSTGKEKGKGKEKDKEKSEEKSKEEKKSNLVKLNLIWEKNMLRKQRNNVV